MVWAGLPSMSLDQRSPPRSIEINLSRISLLYLTGSSLGLHPRRCCPQYEICTNPLTMVKPLLCQIALSSQKIAILGVETRVDRQL